MIPPPPLITITAFGIPAPQGSKNGRAVWKGRGKSKVFTGRIAMQESSAKVKPWREAVEQAAREAAGPRWVPLDGPLIANFCFSLPRGKTVTRYHHTTYPDLSKLIRCAEDALTSAHIWADDARVIGYYLPRKVYAGDGGVDTLPEPGCVIHVYSALDTVREGK